jgi:hypothetical protein
MKPANPTRRRLVGLAEFLALAPVAAHAGDDERRVFITSAIEHPDDNVTRPLH